MTIVGPDLAAADAYATTVFVMGVEGLTWLHRQHPAYAGMVITHDERVVTSTSFAVLRPELVTVR